MEAKTDAAKLTAVAVPEVEKEKASLTVAEAFKRVGRALDELDDANRAKVIRATAILYGVTLV